MSFMTVDGVEIRAPSSYKWGVQDISKPNAGRSLSGKMHKNRKCRKRTLALAWNGLTADQNEAVLKAFEPEYVTVVYPDALGDEEPRVFYSGDQTADMYCWTANKKLYKQTSFSIIER